MQILLIVLSVIVSVLLIVVVLVQKSKGGGLSSTFAGSNQIMGVRRTTDFIEKTTWTLASIVCVLAILSAFVQPKDSGAELQGSKIPTEQPAQGGAPAK